MERFILILICFLINASSNGAKFERKYAHLAKIHHGGLRKNVEANMLRDVLKHFGDTNYVELKHTDASKYLNSDRIAQFKDLSRDTSERSSAKQIPTNCKDIYDLGERENGVYSIYEPENQSKNPSQNEDSKDRKRIDVYCDLDEQYGGHGWLVFQRRQDGSTSFVRNWAEYKNGFGNLNGDFWLGNENLALITNSGQEYELRIDLGDWENEHRFAEYSSFRVHNNSEKYKLDLGEYSGNAGGDGMSHARGRYFSTIDQDHDDWDYIHCALYYRSGFWYGSCSTSTLNNPYLNSSDAFYYDGISWDDWHGGHYALKFVEMKLRPIQ